MRVVKYGLDDGKLQKAREYLIRTRLAEGIIKEDGSFERKKKQIPGYINDAIDYIHAVISLADDESNGVQRTDKSLQMSADAVTKFKIGWRVLQERTKDGYDGIPKSKYEVPDGHKRVK